MISKSKLNGSSHEGELLSFFGGFNGVADRRSLVPGICRFKRGLLIAMHPVRCEQVLVRCAPLVDKAVPGGSPVGVRGCKRGLASSRFKFKRGQIWEGGDMPSERVLTAVGFAARYPDCPAKGLSFWSYTKKDAKWV